MARDATAREHGTDFSLLDHRSSLALAGAIPTPPRPTGTATVAVSADTATPVETTADLEVRDGTQ
ncbi:hypothetical protein [Halorussus amylolyticus]|uniref:hypothetical protein n=1 Tax=Halorussus amylolyticus TaxID=1126242 RepID=UPI00104D4BC4|nr:hypothetical protein [Halorussus amylolyticus]